MFGQEFIHDDKFLALIASIGAIFNAASRLVWGLIIDKLSFKVCYSIMSTLTLALMATFYLNIYIKIKEIYMLWICAMYLISTGLYVITPVVTSRTFGQKNFSANYAIIMSSSSILSTIATGLINSVYYKIGWFYLFLLSTIFQVIGNSY